MKIQAIRFSQNVFDEFELTSLGEIAELLSKETVLWVDIASPRTRGELTTLEQTLKLHPLSLDDCLNVRQRPKVESYENHLFIVTRGVTLDPDVGRFVEGLQLGIFLSKEFVITIHKSATSFDKVKTKLKGRQPTAELGASFLLYTILDNVVDSFEMEVRTMEDWVRQVEDTVLKDPQRETQRKIFTNRRNLLLLRKMIRPQRDAIRLLVGQEFNAIYPEIKIYLMDVLDHAERTIDTIDTQLDMTSGSLDVYLSSMSNKMNDIIKMLTMINTIFMPLTIIVGLYTITFPAPFPKWEYGPMVIILIMVILVSLTIMLFKKRQWF
jgi:magnesium transporter